MYTSWEDFKVDGQKRNGETMDQNPFELKGTSEGHLVQFPCREQVQIPNSLQAMAEK